MTRSPEEDYAPLSAGEFLGLAYEAYTRIEHPELQRQVEEEAQEFTRWVEDVLRLDEEVNTVGEV